MDTNTIAQTTIPFTIDSNTTAAFISAGVSGSITIFVSCYKWIYTWYKKKILFTTYKRYVKEILKNLIYYYDTQKVRCMIESKTAIEYDLDDLRFVFIIKEGNRTRPISPEELITVFISFIGEREILTSTECLLMHRILIFIRQGKFCHPIKLVIGGKDSEASSIFIKHKNKNISATSYGGYIAHTGDKTTLEKVLRELEKNHYDKRIEKIIEKYRDSEQ